MVPNSSGEYQCAGALSLVLTCSSFSRFWEFAGGWRLIARNEDRVKMTKVWMNRWKMDSYVAPFSMSSGSSQVESVIRMNGVCFRRVLTQKNDNNISSKLVDNGKEKGTNKCLPPIAWIMSRERWTSRVDSSFSISSVPLRDAITMPRSSNVPSSLYWCNPSNLVECVVSRTFRYSLLMISTTDISLGTALVDGGKEARVLFLGVVSVGGTDLSTEAGNVSSTIRLLLEASWHLTSLARLTC